MKRRGFLKMMAHAVLLAAVPLRWAAARAVPEKVILAIRARHYPGEIKKWDPTRRPGQGKWAG